MFFGLTIEKLLLIALVAAFVIGPERLPRAAEALARFTKQVRDWVNSAKTRVKDEMGEDFEDVDWRTLDPRQYDPRRIIREALLDDAPTPTVRAAQAAAVTTTALSAPVASPFAGPPVAEKPEAGTYPPFDSEAT